MFPGGLHKVSILDCCLRSPLNADKNILVAIQLCAGHIEDIHRSSLFYSPLRGLALIYVYSRVLLYRKYSFGALSPRSRPFSESTTFQKSIAWVYAASSLCRAVIMLRSCPEVLCLLPSGTGCPVCSLRCRHSPNLAFPPTTRESAVLLRNRRQRTEPETIQNQRKRGRGADRIVGSSVCNPASPYTKTSCLAPGAFGEGSPVR